MFLNRKVYVLISVHFQHSGSSANPGEAVCLENGMSVAQWRKLCFGVSV